MRRIWAVGTALSLCLAITAVPALAQESSESPSAAPDTAAASTTIGFTNFFRGVDFFGQIEAGAREAADAAGVTLLAEDAGGSPTVQADQVEAFIADGVSAIIIVPIDPDAIVPSVEAANVAGIPVLAVDRTANGGMVTSLIASDNVAGGRMAGEALFDAMGGSGKVIEIQGDMAVSAGSERSEGFQQALDATPGITRVMQESAYFDGGLASQITQRGLLEDPDITGVFASNEDMLRGAAQEVSSAGQQDQVKVVGFDTSPLIIAAIRDGSIDATVAQQPRLMGQSAVEAATVAAGGETVETFIPIEIILVTADNVDQFAGVPSGADIAQPEQQAATGPDYAWVTFVTERNCDGDWSQASGGEGDGYTWFRGAPFSCELESNDPRLGGTLTGVFNDDCLGGMAETPCVMWSSERIDGPDGSWSGWVWGTHHLVDEDPQAAPLATLLKVFTGEGGYEGLTLLLHGQGDLGEQMDFHGLIYEGDPPPLPDPVEPAAE